MKIRSHILDQIVTPDCNTLSELYENVTLDCVRALRSLLHIKVCTSVLLENGVLSAITHFVDAQYIACTF